MTKLAGHPLYAICVLGLATGMRRKKLLALRIGDVDFDGASVERSLEDTAKRLLRFKPPKSKHGRGTISLPPSAVVVLRTHWRLQLELRLALRLGKPDADALEFSNPNGSPLSPDNLFRDWRRACRSLGLPMVMFHALRHTHASALIAKGLDVVQISRSAWPWLADHYVAHLRASVQHGGQRRGGRDGECVFRKPGDR